MAAGGLGIGTWTWRIADGSLTWSDGVRAMLQVPQEHPASWESWLMQVHPDDREKVRRSLPPQARGGKAFQPLQYRLIRCDGSELRIEDRRHMAADGTCEGVFIDVTGRERSQSCELSEGDCARRIMEAAGIGIFFRDFETGHSYWSEALSTICGLDAASPPGLEQLMLQVVHPDDAERVRRHVENCRICEGSLEVEFRIVKPSGEQRWVRERGFGSRAADGRVLSYCGAIEDVTDQKQRTAQLEESRRLLELALESTDIGAWEWNRTADRQVWSDAFFRIMGFRRGEVTPGQAPWRAVLHPDDRKWAMELFESDSNSDIHAFTYRIIVDGKVRWIRESWKDFIAEDGSRMRFGVTADITDWKERERRYAVTDRWLQLAVNGGRIGLWSHDDGAGFYHWNDFMFTLLGYPRYSGTCVRMA